MTHAVPLVEAEGLTRDYGDLRALDGLDLRLGRGEVLGLLGPNGAGKTTAMRLLCGTLAPSAGQVRIAGIDLLAAPREAKAALGYLPEVPPLYPDMTVDAFLAFAAALRGVRRAARAAAVERAVERTGLGDVRRRLVGHLSLGYRQRTGIAQALVHDPAVLVLDEPTIGLDPIQIREIRALVGELGRERGVILSTHVLPEVRMLCSRVTILHRGSVAYAASLAELDAAPAERVVVGLESPPARDELDAVAGIEGVEALGGGRFRVRLDTARLSAACLAETLVARGWGLTELTPERAGLEQVFVDVTARDVAGEAAPRPTEAPG